MGVIANTALLRAIENAKALKKAKKEAAKQNEVSENRQDSCQSVDGDKDSK